MAREFYPLGDNVLVELVPEVEKIGSLYLPDEHRHRPKYATVKATGPGEIRVDEDGREWPVPMEVAPGDVVVIPWKTGRHTSVGLMVTQRQILGIAEGFDPQRQSI